MSEYRVLPEDAGDDLADQAEYYFGIFELAVVMGMPPDKLPTWLHGFTTALRFAVEHPEQLGPLASAYCRAEALDPNIGPPPDGLFAKLAEGFPEITRRILATLEEEDQP